jgi:tetratricopeptide (TPR) repeat protein
VIQACRDPLDLFHYLRKGGLLVGCSLLCFYSFQSVLAHFLRLKNPELALRFEADSPAALALRAEELLSKAVLNQKQTTKVELIASRLATKSLAQQGVNAIALRVLGNAADAGGRRNEAKTLMQLSERISRREISTQLWLIESSVREGNVSAALAHYDLSLRTTPQIYEFLFPKLSEALVDREIQTAFVQHIRRTPPWLEDFLTYAIAQGGRPQDIVATILLAGPLPNSDPYRELESRLIERLAATNAFDSVEPYYLSLRRSHKYILTSMAFDKLSTDNQFPPITWKISETATQGGSFVAGNPAGARVFKGYSAPGARGVVLSKLLFLPPAAYTLSAKRRIESLVPESSARWQIRCNNDSTGVPLLSLQDNLSRLSLKIDVAFTVPANCRSQYAEFSLVGGVGQAEVAVTIEHVQIAKSVD